jgi:Domain of unknown function (DUF5615)
VKVRFLADADLNKAIVTGLVRREPSLDFLTALAAGLRGMHDAEVLALAAGLRRVLVSHDVGTMPPHFQSFRKAGNHSSGVFLIPQFLEVGVAIDELLLIWAASRFGVGRPSRVASSLASEGNRSWRHQLSY